MSISNLDRKLLEVLVRRPLGLVFDIDGTLSPIAPTPGEARLYPGVATLLRQAIEYPDVHVAIITGRSVESGAAVVNVDGLTYIGTHGLEWSNGLPSSPEQIEITPEALKYAKPGQQLLDLAEQKLADYPGILVERKRVGGSIHYRLSPEPEVARQTILSLLQEPAEDLHMHLSEGKRIVEIKVPLAINKGEALRRFVQRYDLQGILFAGDDLTDLDAIMEITRLKKEGLAALSIVVRHADTPPALLANADREVEEVDGLAALFHEIVAFLANRATM